MCQANSSFQPKNTAGYLKVVFTTFHLLYILTIENVLHVDFRGPCCSEHRLNLL